MIWEWLSVVGDRRNNYIIISMIDFFNIYFGIVYPRYNSSKVIVLQCTSQLEIIMIC